MEEIDYLEGLVNRIIQGKPVRDLPEAMGAVRSLGAEIERLRAHIASMDYIPLRYSDRPPGFVAERRKHCTTPHLCFEFGDSAPVCGPCDTAAVKVLLRDTSVAKTRVGHDRSDR